jgi:hypothetical protein
VRGGGGTSYHGRQHCKSPSARGRQLRSLDACPGEGGMGVLSGRVKMGNKDGMAGIWR